MFSRQAADPCSRPASGLHPLDRAHGTPSVRRSNPAVAAGTAAGVGDFEH